MPGFGKALLIGGKKLWEQNLPTRKKQLNGKMKHNGWERGVEQNKKNINSNAKEAFTMKLILNFSVL